MKFLCMFIACAGEKYLGYWSNNMKHGCGLIVTLDGIYYEGVFTQGVLTVSLLHTYLWTSYQGFYDEFFAC